MRALADCVLKPLTFIGALNWGLIGFFGFDLVAFLFGPMTTASRVVYCLVGIAAVVLLFVEIANRPTKLKK